jgi:plastocyanin
VLKEKILRELDGVLEQPRTEITVSGTGNEVSGGGAGQTLTVDGTGNTVTLGGAETSTADPATGATPGTAATLAAPTANATTTDANNTLTVKGDDNKVSIDSASYNNTVAIDGKNNTFAIEAGSDRNRLTVAGNNNQYVVTQDSDDNIITTSGGSNVTRLEAAKKNTVDIIGNSKNNIVTISGDLNTLTINQNDNNTVSLTGGEEVVITNTVKAGADSGARVFDPASVTIKSGETLTFRNNTGFPHNIVFDEDGVPPEIDAGAISRDDLLTSPGDTHSVQLTERGEYNYSCEVHGERGKITVV